MRKLTGTLGAGRVMAGLALAVVEIARADGVDLGDVLRDAGLDRDALRASDAYVPVEAHERLWGEGARRTGRTDFGMFAAEHFPPGLTGVVEYVLRNCATVRDAAETWVRLAGAVSDSIHGELVEQRGDMKLVWSLDRPPSPGASHWSEFAQARTLKLMRDALGEPELAPIEVWFRHAPLGDLNRHRAFFRAPLSFGRPETALIWSKELLERPLQWVDATARRALEDRAERLIRDLEVDLPQKVEAAVMGLIREPGADIRLSRVAERVRMRPRTIQARLEQEGVSFRALAERVRLEEASRLLAAGEVTRAEIARRLGYSDASALRRALRRWRGRA